VSRITQNNFSLGELSPRTYGRNDQEWFSAGCRKMENFIALPQGPAEARPGTIRVDELLNPEENTRVKGITTSSGDDYLLLITETAIFVYTVDTETETASAMLTADGDLTSIDVEYQDIPLEELQIVFHAGSIYIAHYKKQLEIFRINKEQAVISRSFFTPYYRAYYHGDTYEVNSVVSYNGTQYMANKTSTNVYPPESEGTYEQLLYIPILRSSSVDCLAYDSEGTYEYGDLCIYNSRLYIVGQQVPHYVGYSSSPNPSLSLVGYSYAYYPGVIPRKKDTQKYVTGVTIGYSSPIYTYAYIATDVPNYERCNDTLAYINAADPAAPTSPGAGLEWISVSAIPAVIGSMVAYSNTDSYEIGDFLHYKGYIYQCTSSTGSTAPYPDAVTSQEIWDAVGDAPSFSIEGEFPNLIMFHDGRMYILGTEKKPNTVYSSRINKYADFNMGPLDSDGMQFPLTIEGEGLISWGQSSGDILIGGAEKEILITGGGNPITPSNNQAYPQSEAGSGRLGVLNIADITAFFQPGGHRVLQFVYSNDTKSYLTPDIGRLGEHLLAIGVKSFALQTNPDFILWCVMDDGTLLGGSYIQEAQILGWHNHTTDGEFDSVEVTRGDFEDIIWVTVKRPIRDADGATTGYIRQLERFAPRRQAHDENMVYMDDAEILTIVDGKATVSDSKKGQTLTVIQGGAPHQDVTADPETGEITLQYVLADPAFNTCVVGRAYTPKLSPQKILPGGSTLNMAERISEVSVRFLDSLGVAVGIEGSDVDPIPFRDGTGNYGEVVPPFTGELQKSVNDSFDGKGWLLIERQQPFPVTILAVTYELEARGI
jgi:hypothetical protein